VTVQSPEPSTSPHIRRAIRTVLLLDAVLVAAAIAAWFLTERPLWLYVILAPAIVVPPVLMFRAVQRAREEADGQAAGTPKATDIVQ